MRTAALVVVAAALAACRFTDPDMREDAVAYSQLAAHESRTEMVKDDPSLEAHMKSAAGWAAFGSTGDSLFSRRPGDALGLAHDNRTGKETPMRVLVPNVDRSVGLPRYRGLLVFADATEFAQFVKGGPLPAAGEGVDIRWTVDGVPASPPDGATCRPE